MAIAQTGARFCIAPLDLVVEAAAALADPEAEGVATVEEAVVKTVGMTVLREEGAELEAAERLAEEGTAEYERVLVPPVTLKGAE